jgi:hypothetical protein
MYLTADVVSYTRRIYGRKGDIVNVIERHGNVVTLKEGYSCLESYLSEEIIKRENQSLLPREKLIKKKR